MPKEPEEPEEFREAYPENVDPILSPHEMCRDAGISLATWYRNYRNKLDILQLSARRIGCRRSVWRKAFGEGAS